MPLYQAHDLMSKIEKTIQKILPGVDVMVHPEPEYEAQRVTAKEEKT